MVSSDVGRGSAFYERSWLRLALSCVIVLEAVGLYVARRPWENSDSHVYLSLADALSRLQFGWPRADGGYEPEAGFPMGYPLFLTFLRNEVHLPVGAIVLLQLLLCLGAVFYFARALQARGLPANLFLLVVAAYPFPFAYAAAISKEALAMSTTTVAVSLLLQPARQPLQLVVPGACAGLAGLIVPPLVMVLPVLLAAFVLSSPPAERGEIAVRRCSWFIAGAVAALVPVMAFNATHFGMPKPVPAAGPLGPSLYAASWIMTDVSEDVLSHGRREQLPRELVDEVESMQKELGAPFAWPVNAHNYATAAQQMDSNRVYRSHALQRIRARPWLYVRYVLTQPWRLWNSGLGLKSGGASGTAFMLLRAAQGLVWLLALAGMAVALSKWRQWILLTVYPIVITAVHSFLHAEARYTAAVRWFAAALAALALHALLLRTSKARAASNRLGGAAAPAPTPNMR
jgi:hypothetical protein